MDVNIKSKGGYTALHLAVIQGHESVIASLLDCGADIDARDNSGRKPKHYIKDNTSPWIQSKLGKRLAPSVFVSSGDNPDKGLQNIGSMFLQSNSLGTGMDKLDGDKDVLPPRQKPARSGSFAKIYRNFTAKFKDKKPVSTCSKLEIPENTARYHRTGRARSAPDINHITGWSPRFVHVMP